MQRPFKVPTEVAKLLQCEGSIMGQRGSGFWSTLPGILTGLAAVITAVTGVVLALHGSQEKAAAPPSAAAAEGEHQASVDAGHSTTGQGATTPNNGEVRATVVDPDGWTNLRSGPTTSSSVVRRINEGEVFWTHPQHDGWWHVRTADGTEGYIHHSRIRLIS